MRRVAGVLVCLVAVVTAEVAEEVKKVDNHEEVSKAKSGPDKENADPGSVQVCFPVNCLPIDTPPSPYISTFYM